MSTNQTPNYQLSQWEATDQVLRADFNADNAKIDGALKAEADARAAETAALAAQVALRGNCQIYYTSYTGSGGSGPSQPNSLSFPKAPALVVIAEDGVQSSGQYTAIMVRGSKQYAALSRSPSNATASWGAGGYTVSWYALEGRPYEQMNTKNTTYYVVALCPV